MQAMEGSYTQLAEDLAGSHVRIAKFQADIDREFAQERFGLKTFPTIVFLPKTGSQVRCVVCPFVPCPCVPSLATARSHRLHLTALDLPQQSPRFGGFSRWETATHDHGPLLTVRATCCK